jgi:hypothetical protein
MVIKSKKMGGTCYTDGDAIILSEILKRRSDFEGVGVGIIIK